MFMDEMAFLLSFSGREIVAPTCSPFFGSTDFVRDERRVFSVRASFTS